MTKIEELEAILRDIFKNNNNAITTISFNDIQNKLSEVAKEIYKLEEQNKENVRQVQMYKDEVKTMKTKCDMYNSMLRGIVEDY